MKVRLGSLRRLVREVIVREWGGPAGASGSDPAGAQGFYPYELDRGVDIHGFWYRSPGRPVGTEGDPYRAEDAALYIGQKPPPDSAVDTPGEDAAEDMEPEAVMPLQGVEGEPELPEDER